jgi:uncharacterized membrane protein
MGKNQRNKSFALTFSLVAVLLLILIISNISALTISDVRTSPSEVAPGQNARISIDIENNMNDDVENVDVLLDFSSLAIPIAPFEGSSETAIGDINSDDKETASFNVIVLPEAKSGIYKIPVKISYNIVNENATLQKNGTISLVVNSQPKVKISGEGNLVRGIESSITLRIINDGLSDIKLASIQLSQPSSATVSSPLYEYLGNIDSNDFDSVDLKITANENSASYISIPIFITYKDSTNKDLAQSETVMLRVYSQDEAKKMGFIKRPNYTLYFLVVALILAYVIYRIRKRIGKRKAQGA